MRCHDHIWKLENTGTCHRYLSFPELIPGLFGFSGTRYLIPTSTGFTGFPTGTWLEYAGIPDTREQPYLSQFITPACAYCKVQSVALLQWELQELESFHQLWEMQFLLSVIVYLPEENTCWQGTEELKLPNMGKWNHLAMLAMPYPPSDYTLALYEPFSTSVL